MVRAAAFDATTKSANFSTSPADKNTPQDGPGTNPLRMSVFTITA